MGSFPKESTLNLPGAEPAPREGPRVLLLSRCASAYGSSRGGVDVLSQRHAMILAKQGCRVVFVGTEPVLEPGIDTIVVHTRDLIPIRTGHRRRNSFAYLVNEGFHVIHGALSGAITQRRESTDLVLSNSSIATLILRLLARRRPLIHYVHDGLYAGDADRPATRRLVGFVLNNVLEKLALRAADRTICASDPIFSQAVAAGVPSSRLTVMYPLLPESYAASKNPDEPPAIPAGGLRPFVLSVGQQTGRKRFDMVIQTLAQMPPPTRLVLVGDGPLHEVYRKAAADFGVADRVVFLRNVSDATLSELYQQCEAYVLVSDNEGFPITVAEALIHGAPVVLACPSATELASRLESPYLVSVRNARPGDIARAIAKVTRGNGTSSSAVRPSIRSWAARMFPSEADIQSQYERLFGAVLGDSTAIASEVYEPAQLTSPG